MGNDLVNKTEKEDILHHKVGKAVRQTIEKIGGTMPEDLPTPNKSAKQIEREKNRKIVLKDNNK